MNFMSNVDYTSRRVMTYEISHRTFQITNTTINSIKIHSVTETNDNRNKNDIKCQ